MPDFPALTPEPPYFAVIFSSRKSADDAGYQRMAEKMVQMASDQPGFLGVESVRQTDGTGLTVSYWRNEADIRAWKAVTEHRQAQTLGQEKWYAAYTVRIARVERAYGSPTDFPEAP